MPSGSDQPSQPETPAAFDVQSDVSSASLDQPSAKSGRRSGGWMGRLLGSVVATVLLLSISMNVWLGQILSGMFAGPTEVTYQAGETDDRIVILPIAGTITDETYLFVHDAIEVLREDPPAALILRVNSPGGAVGASDRIWHELRRFQQDMADEGSPVPMVASFGSYAASGGYYVASLADVIVAEQTTITGSIGVIAQAFTVEKLLEKVGVQPEIIASSEANEKDALSPFRAWGEHDRDKLRAILDEAHSRFVEVVYTGRQNHLSREAVAQLATGEAFTASVAVENKLVDEVGYLDRAIELAAMHIKDFPAEAQPHVTEMRPPATINLANLVLGQSDAGTPLSQLNQEQLRNWLLEVGTPRVMYRMTLR